MLFGVRFVDEQMASFITKTAKQFGSSHSFAARSNWFSSAIFAKFEPLFNDMSKHSFVFHWNSHSVFTSVLVVIHKNFRFYFHIVTFVIGLIRKRSAVPYGLRLKNRDFLIMSQIECTFSRHVVANNILFCLRYTFAGCRKIIERKKSFTWLLCTIKSHASVSFWYYFVRQLNEPIADVIEPQQALFKWKSTRSNKCLFPQNEISSCDKQRHTHKLSAIKRLNWMKMSKPTMTANHLQIVKFWYDFDAILELESKLKWLDLLKWQLP